MHRFRPFLTGAVAAAVVLGVVAPAHAETDYFLEIEGIAGESNSAQFADAIDVSSYSWGASRDNKAQFQNFHVTKDLDLASPALFRAVAQATTVPSAELIGVKVGGDTSQVFVRYCLQGVRVSSVQQSGSSGPPQPTEQVSFSYGTVSEQYNNGVDPTVFAGWNITAGLLMPSYPANCGGPL